MNNMKSLILLAVIVAVMLTNAGCKKGGKVASMTMSPASTIIAPRTLQQLHAITTLDDGSVFDFTQVVEWSSSHRNIADVNNVPGSKGIVTAGTTTGTVTITAFDTVNHLFSTAIVTVDEPQAISVTPAHPHMAINTSHQFRAIASFPSGTITQDLTLSSHTTWTTTDSVIASIQNAPGAIGNGFATANSTGPTDIKASFESVVSDPVTSVTTTTLKNGFTPLLVTDMAVSSIIVAFTPLSAGTATFMATGIYPAGSVTSDQPFTSSVSWSSSNTNVATIDISTGIATAGSVTGTAIITATDLITNLSGTAELQIP